MIYNFGNIPKRNENYKTRLCNNFQSTGACKFGASCLYAHGPAELRMKYENEVYQ